MKFLDFFSGIGGFRLGMEMAGHECVGHCEIDKFADKSYRAMHNVKDGEWYAANIRDVEPGDLPEADCYCFGFPCQAFSIAGKRGGFEDTRGTLFFEVMRLAAVRKPKYLFAENVAGLLSHDGGKTFGTILNTLGELGYWYEYQVLNSRYIGVPQNRERVYIVGHLRETSVGKVFPITGTSKPVGAKISLVAHRENYRRNYQVYEPSGSVEAIDTGQGGGRHPHVIIGKDGKSKNKEYASCLTGGGHSGGNHSDMDLLFDGERVRRLTPRECFRLQGFPDEYFDRAAIVNSDSQLYKQAGNSVTVNVIHAIAERL